MKIEARLFELLTLFLLVGRVVLERHVWVVIVITEKLRATNTT